MTSGLTAWLAEPSRDHGIHFSDGDVWSFRPYSRIASDAALAAELLRAEGVVPGDVVCVIVAQGSVFAAGFMGVLAAGAVPCVIAPPGVFQGLDAYLTHVASLLCSARPRAVLIDAGDEQTVRAAIDAAALDVECLEMPPPAERDVSLSPAFRAPDDVTLVQFTSGSSGNPRAIALTRSNVEENVGTIRRWLGMSKDDVTCSWLPVYHDMGLLGCLLTPIVNGSDAWIMRPEEFVRRPLKWLECLGRYGAGLTAAPSFGYGYVAKHVKPEQLEGFDFAHCRASIVGAERIDARGLAAFTSLLAPRGFRAEAIVPAYGLAEATLTVTGSALTEMPFAVRLDWTHMSFGAPVRILERAELRGFAGAGPGWLVASGTPHIGTSVVIDDGDGRPLGEGCLGEIVVRGPSVGRVYAGDGSESSTRFDGRALHTGDAGFLLDENLFVVGRMGDRIKVRGRHLYAEELEDALVALARVPRGRGVVVPGPDEDRVRSIVALVEAAPADWVEQARTVLRRAVGSGTDVEVRCVAPGTIPRTSSGKPRRRVLWRRLVEEARDLPPDAVGVADHADPS